MERLLDAVRGYARVRVTGAEPAAFLDECLREGLEFWAVYPEDEFTLRLTMDYRDSRRARAAAERCYCQAEILKRGGGPEAAKKFKRRVALWFLPLALLAALTAASFFVWRIDVEGAETVSEVKILNALADCGVEIGGYWPAYNSELIRSRVLEKIPELKWVSLSLFGSRVHVEVREKTQPPELFDESLMVRLVAKKGGLIQEVSALRGAALVSPGDTAAQGDTLIDSAVVSPFAGARYVHAAGGVMARTWYELTAILPMEYAEKSYTGGEKTRVGLKFGDERVNFYGTSGIWGGMCDNIITEHALGIEGVFTLPVSLVVMTMEEYELQPRTIGEAEAADILEARLNAELLSALGDSGQTLDAEFSFTVTDGCGVGTLRAECLEDIAKEEPLAP